MAGEKQPQSASNHSTDKAESEKALDNRLMELLALFEIGKLLNSSLNLKSILDNMLLSPMGKMMISKGMVLLNKEKNLFVIETIKGLPRNLISKQLEFEPNIASPTFVRELAATGSPCISFFIEFGIELLLPIISVHRWLGIIGFGGKILGNAYTESELEFLNSLTNIAATSIENGLVFKELNDVNRRLDKKNQELNTLFEIGKELNSTLDSDKILNLLIFAIMGEMMINRCAVFLNNDNMMQLMLTKGIGNIDEDLSTVDEQELSNYLCDIVQPIALDDEFFEKYGDHFRLFFDKEFRVMVPMRIQDDTRGVIIIGDKITKQTFTEDELDFLYTLGNQAMISLENARLFEETLEKQRMEEELLIAKDIQARLLPKECPDFAHIEITGVNVPSRQVGGDYYDCIKIDATHYGIAIGDVSGKGVPASLLMSNVQASLHALVGTGMPIPNMIAKINNLIYDNTTLDKFITFFYGVLDIGNLEFTYCNAGHNPPYFYHRDNTFQLLEKGGLLLGMMPNVQYEIETVQLESGDWIIMYTDGVTEAMNENDEEFEERRLEDVIKKNQNATAEEMMSNIAQAVKEFVQDVPQSDDITMVVVKTK